MSVGIDPADLAHCREVIRTGSLSFHAASKLLPARVRDPALALYAFCRLADDEVDEGGDKAKAVLRLSERLDQVYARRPRNAPEDRAFAAIVDQFDMPRALPEALLEGLAWDAEERRYADLSGVCDYSARVASAVGAMMCVLMGVRDKNALARACDLGVAMQLTNIARDVGEDARAGRIYLPLAWLEETGMTPDDLLRAKTATPEIRAMVARLLSTSHRLYLRSESGVGSLPVQARMGIYAARFIYAGIGTALRRQGCDSITQRARTSKLRKISWMGRASAYSAASLVMPQSATVFAPPLAEVAFLVHAAAAAPTGVSVRGQGRAGAVLQTLADLKARELFAHQDRSGAPS
jgi:phytoene synthase